MAEKEEPVLWGKEHKFNKAMEFTSKWEGGLVNDKYDKGGQTKYGISKRWYPDLDIENLTRKQAKQIYRTEYFDKTGASELPLPLAMQVFDYAVNSGASTAIKDLQRIIGAEPDGRIGPATLEAIKSVDQSKLLNDYINARSNNYNRIIKNDPTQERFKKGWFNRLNDMSKSTIT